LNYGLVLIISIGVVFILMQWRHIFIPIAIAVTIWYVINALARALGRISIAGVGLPRFVCTAGAVVTVIAAGVMLTELLAESVRAFQTAAPRYEQQLQALLEKYAKITNLDQTPTVKQIISGLNIEALAATLAESAASIFFNALLIFFYVLFLMVQQKYMPKKLRLMIRDENRRQTVEAMIARIQHNIQTYIGVMVFLAIVTGAVTYLVLSLVGVDFAVLWSVIIALFSFIPTIGTAFGIVLPSLIALLQFDTFTPFLIVLATLGAAQVILNNFAQPALMGRSLNLSSVVILAALAVWGTIWGVTGAILCIPITVAMMIVFSHFEATRSVAVLLSLDGEIE
jgi:predicted PurR-regulated permease PerM